MFTAIVSYTFFGLDEIGDDLEDPLGFDESDLPRALEPVEYVPT